MVEILNKVQPISLNYGTITRDSPVRYVWKYNPTSTQRTEQHAETSCSLSSQASGWVSVFTRICGKCGLPGEKPLPRAFYQSSGGVWSSAQDRRRFVLNKTLLNHLRNNFLAVYSVSMFRKLMRTWNTFATKKWFVHQLQPLFIQMSSTTAFTHNTTSPCVCCWENPFTLKCVCLTLQTPQLYCWCITVWHTRALQNQPGSLFMTGTREMSSFFFFFFLENHLSIELSGPATD